jgi:hypothetical protein
VSLRLLTLGLLPWAGAVRAADEEPALSDPFQLSLGGEASGAVSERDPNHFNESEYGLNALRQFRVGLCAELKAGPHLSVLGELRSENLAEPRVYALYMRVRPLNRIAFDLQAGLVPPVFGAFPRQNYGVDPALIGYPLPYHYPTIVRADAAPAGVADMQRRRGLGSSLHYPLGADNYDHGLPLVNALRWDTGIQAHLSLKPWEMSAAMTQGTLGHPLTHDDNGSKQASGRLAWHAPFGLTVGVSGARGGYATRDLVQAIPVARGRTFYQRALGADAEFARGHWILRGETVYSSWDAVSNGPPLLGGRLTATAVSVEARYRLLPGMTMAVRGENLGFSEVPGPTGPVTWDAPVSRVEVGLGYSLHRHFILKVAYQHNRRDSLRRDFVAVQGITWF